MFNNFYEIKLHRVSREIKSDQDISRGGAMLTLPVFI